MSRLDARRSVDHGAHLPFELDSLVESIAQRVAEIVTANLLEQFEAPEDHRWVTSKEAAAHLGITLNALYKLAAAGSLPSAQDERGGRHYFTRADLDAWRRGSGHG
jgi:excisionase family DNA binding protein